MAAIVEAKALPQILAAFAGRKESVLDGIQWCPIKMRAACFAPSFLQKRGV